MQVENLGLFKTLFNQALLAHALAFVEINLQSTQVFYHLATQLKSTT